MNIDKRALREVAEKATPGNWRRTSSLFNGITVTPFSLCGEEVTLAHTVEKRDAEFIAAANPATMLALLDELEHYKSREERVTKLVMDNSTSWDALYKKLEAAEKRIAEQSAIVAAAEKLVRCKGRYHSELNYRALAKLFGVVTPDLPPLEHENVHYADAAEVFRIALASLDAKPIYQYQSGIYNDDNGETDWYWDDCDAGFYKQYAADRRRIVYPAAPAPVVPEKLPCSVELKPGLIIGKGCKIETLLTALRRRAEYYAKLEAMTPEEREKHGASIESFKAMLPQPAPVDKEFIPKNLDKALGVVGVALPESKEEFNFQIERWIQRLIDRVIRYADEFKEQPVPVVPEERPSLNNGIVGFDEGWNACRAAMLNGGKS
ncbi:ead/Ea22-like family protein [Salmonella enterica]|uniref:ead/Ea22-like family protein n=2 Tax=Salmonella enterica TaxID=28901 RepID=UPI000A322782|nr:ead/Ea22-like family protein [Salmonella enterica]ECU8338313.1 ead/Ea22-like family protein [Salmonella enterica subsp. enterica serovar Mississippi]ECW0844284.1 ead/Ea22-like family protein [Salmonella enterica subsp. enterica]ECW0928871.1 ead/Ea22-like family protein [Salmonella enterica subsp. enterica]ECW0959327.1 ead/Ea22-like family protein [Salmonella enterica subsp. enterica]